MLGFVPGIHDLLPRGAKDVDGRDIGERKRRRPLDGLPDHDELGERHWHSPTRSPSISVFTSLINCPAIRPLLMIVAV